MLKDIANAPVKARWISIKKMKDNLLCTKKETNRWQLQALKHCLSFNNYYYCDDIKRQVAGRDDDDTV